MCPSGAAFVPTGKDLAAPYMICTGEPDFIGLIMPKREVDLPTSMPEWSRLPSATPVTDHLAAAHDATVKAAQEQAAA